MARHRYSHPPFDQINMTSLIDTLFFLLIIFMMTAPMLEYSMDITPPANNAAQIKPDDFSKTVNVKKDGSIMFDSRQYTPETLAQRLSELKSENKKYNFFLRADLNLRYGDVIDVLRSIKRAGFSEIALVTAAEE